MTNFLKKHLTIIIVLLSTFISVVAFYYFYTHGQQNLADYDALARLNIARKMIDSLTPGWGQLGGIWLPFPQVLMVPFIRNDFLWHSGFAGAFISMTSFITAAVFLYKTTVRMTGNKLAGVAAWAVFVTNVNILWLQTMAMSESFFLFTVVMALFFLTTWAEKKNLVSLLKAAFFVALATLTRYEGYFILIGACICVITIAFIEYRKDGYSKIEGLLILFATLASFGVILWLLYSALIYKDPLYWLHLYSQTTVQIPQPVTNQGIDNFNALGNADRVNGWLISFLTYSRSMFWMNGIIVTTASVLGFLLLIVTSIISFIKKQINLIILPVIIVGLVLYSFLIFGYQRGLIPSVEMPRLNWATLIDKTSYTGGHSNIRYGIVFLPILALAVGFLSARKKVITALVAIVVALQVLTNWYSPLFLMFQLPRVTGYSTPPSVNWFKQHYDGGLILVSANRFENFMFQTGLRYNNFIYEGSQKYWLDSLREPATYATWVIFDSNLKGDAINDYLDGHYDFSQRFNAVYQEEGFTIYHIKDQPDSKISIRE